MILRIEVVFFLFIVINACNTSSEGQPIADLIITNANIVTVDSTFSKAKTMVIKDGLIVYVGQEEKIEKWKGEHTQIIDLRGYTVLPGFVEPHTHPIASAALYDWVDVSGMKHKAAKSALRALQKTARETPKGEWILAFGWDMILLDGAFPLTADYLDRNISNEHPIWVMMQSMHTHFLNTMAMKKAGINDKTPDPIGGGYYQKDSKGHLTGVATESATVAPLLLSMPVKKREDVKRAILRMYSRYNAVGITAIGATGLINLFPGYDAYSICEEIAQEEFCPIRLFHYAVGYPILSDTAVSSDNWYIRNIGQKYWIDGSPYTGSMLTREPYLTSDLNQNKLDIPIASHGHLMYPRSLYTQMFSNADQLGWQISIHSQGDSAAQEALTALDIVAKNKGFKEHRHRMEHLALVTDEQLQHMAEIGITPSFHINHLYYYGDALSESIIGKERINRLMPLASALKYGHKISLHSDSPMYPPNPLLTVKTAVTRQSSNTNLYGSDQYISVADAIRAITIYPAWQMHADKEIGSLEIGKRADFVILEEDPTTVMPARIDHIRVIATFINGQKAI